MASIQSEVSALLESWSQAARMKDIDRLMSLYSPDITYFDVVPPLRYTGPAAVRGNFLRWFDGFKSSIGQEICDLNILVSGDIATAYHAYPSKRNPEERARGRILGTRYRLLPTLRSQVVDYARTYLTAR